MATAAAPAKPIPWWKEPTKDQWYAWWAAWMGWTLDAFDFTVFETTFRRSEEPRVLSRSLPIPVRKLGQANPPPLRGARTPFW
jgi:hypothetical protein